MHKKVILRPILWPVKIDLYASVPSFFFLGLVDNKHDDNPMSKRWCQIQVESCEWIHEITIAMQEKWSLAIRPRAAHMFWLAINKSFVKSSSTMICLAAPTHLPALSVNMKTSLFVASFFPFFCMLNSADHTRLHSSSVHPRRCCPASLWNTSSTQSVLNDGTTSAHAHVSIAVCPALMHRSWCLWNHLSYLLIKTTYIALGAVTTTARAFWVRFDTAIRVAFIASTRANGYRQSLNHTRSHRLTWSLTREHAIIDGEVSTKHERLRRCVLLGQCLCYVGNVCPVFAIVDSNLAAVAMTSLIGLVTWFWPSTSLTKTCQVWSAGFDL